MSGIVVGEAWRKSQEGKLHPHAKEGERCVIGPSGIPRLSKWRKRHDKAAQHRANKRDEAEQNRSVERKSR